MAQARSKKKKTRFFSKAFLWLTLLLVLVGVVIQMNWESIPKKPRKNFEKNFALLSERAQQLEWENFSFATLSDLTLGLDWDLKFNLPQWVYFWNFEPAQKPVVKQLQKLLPPPPIKIKPQPLRPRPGQRLYYIRVGRCLKTTCVKQLRQTLSKLGIKPLQKKWVERLTYYEVLSEETFFLQEAEAKLELIESLNETSIRAFLQKAHGGWRVSFGSFPEKYRAEKARDYLSGLYLDTGTTFLVKPQKINSKSVAVFAGPYLSKLKAEKKRQTLLEAEGLQEAWVTNRF